MKVKFWFIVPEGKKRLFDESLAKDVFSNQEIVNKLIQQIRDEKRIRMVFMVFDNPDILNFIEEKLAKGSSEIELTTTPIFAYSRFKDCMNWLKDRKTETKEGKKAIEIYCKLSDISKLNEGFAFYVFPSVWQKSAVAIAAGLWWYSLHLKFIVCENKIFVSTYNFFGNPEPTYDIIAILERDSKKDDLFEEHVKEFNNFLDDLTAYSLPLVTEKSCPNKKCNLQNNCLDKIDEMIRKCFLYSMNYENHESRVEKTHKLHFDHKKASHAIFIAPFYQNSGIISQNTLIREFEALREVDDKKELIMMYEGMTPGSIRHLRSATKTVCTMPLVLLKLLAETKTDTCFLVKGGPRWAQRDRYMWQSYEVYGAKIKENPYLETKLTILPQAVIIGSGNISPSTFHHEYNCSRTSVTPNEKKEVRDFFLGRYGIARPINPRTKNWGNTELFCIISRKHIPKDEYEKVYSFFKTIWSEDDETAIHSFLPENYMKALKGELNIKELTEKKEVQRKLF